MNLPHGCQEAASWHNWCAMNQLHGTNSVPRGTFPQKVHFS